MIQAMKNRVSESFLEGRIGNVRLTLGRYHSFVADGNLYDHRVDGMKWYWEKS